MAMGAETSKFVGSIFIQTCHWSASENENENKEIMFMHHCADDFWLHL